ncbi:metallophosphoesterase [Limoniibacter endophyticus]|uniref:Metallophosphatase n=1 Tax=Limoniibacter endophyticus TaxID=1565040 RepID=A0A8J3DQV5_9HYPH|nr:metallophosphoesterase [Limoniibacter endophyticus]GHC67767.1 metallophosphatase [Limoniibacter endophyticus]
MNDSAHTHQISLSQARGPENCVLYAIGDIHGRYDLMQAMERSIALDFAERGASRREIIFLGDYVDRGPQSRQVLERLSQLRAAPDIHILCGNHDAAMVEFLDHPSGEGLFALNGGDATARSYGIEIDFTDPLSLARGHQALCEAIPPEHVELLRNMPDRYVAGDFFFCHAGIDPTVALENQEHDDLLWIRKLFLDCDGLHPKVIVHGHTPTKQVEMLPNRVNLDTHAWKRGVLSALVIDGPEKKIIQAGEA